ncbi:MAG: type II 3-dehydroquinate dehydratase [Oscillospiraceae bacterium]|nr:type II 3-dehydroquinate dehydratase [Oscillospiraceae bacterium]
MKILIINGPNLNLLGERNPDVYGSLTLEGLETRIAERAEEYNWQAEFFQSNHEGEIIDRLHTARHGYDAVIINPGGYSHTSVAIRDAIEAIPTPVIEVHISNIHAREEFRHRSLISPVCRGSIVGFGAAGYVLALEALLEME